MKYFPIIPACDGEDQGIWSLKKCRWVLSKLSSKNMHNYGRPTPDALLPLTIKFQPLRPAVMLQNRGRFSPACIPAAETSQLRLSVCLSVLCRLSGLIRPLPACSPVHQHIPSTECYSLRVIVCMCHALLPPAFVPRVVCDIILHFTHQLKMPPQEDWDAVLSEAPGCVGFPICICWFQLPGFRCYLFQRKGSSLQNVCLSSYELLKDLKVLVLFGIVLLCFTVWPGADVKLRVGSFSEFLVGRRQTRFTNESTLASTVTDGGRQPQAVRAFPEANLHQSPGGKSEFLPLPWVDISDQVTFWEIILKWCHTRLFLNPDIIAVSIDKFAKSPKKYWLCKNVNFPPTSLNF